MMRQITDEVYLLESTKGAYSYLIKAEEWILIDTHFSFAKQALLKDTVHWS